MANSNLPKLIGTLGAVLLADWVFSKLIPDAIWKSDVVQLLINIIANIVAAFATLWVMSLLNSGPASAEAAPAATGVRQRLPVNWRRRTTVAILTGFTILILLITQQFLDAFWFHANELKRASLLSDAGLQRLGIFYAGAIPVLIGFPFIIYVSLSVGRRQATVPRYTDFLLSAFLGLGIVAVWNLVRDLVSGRPAPFWQAFPRIPGDSPNLVTFDNAVGYVLQIALFLVVVGLHALWMKVWSYVGWWLKNRGLV